MNLQGLFPKLTFFVVQSDNWNERFRPEININVRNRIFCTLEKSLSLRVVSDFIDNTICPSGCCLSINFWKPEYHNRLGWELNNPGIAFAETRKVYRRKDLEEFKKDYLVAMLSGLKQ